MLVAAWDAALKGGPLGECAGLSPAVEAIGVSSIMTKHAHGTRPQTTRKAGPMQSSWSRNLYSSTLTDQIGEASNERLKLLWQEMKGRQNRKKKR